MPFIRVDWFPGRTLEQKRELAKVLTREFARIAKCQPETINFIFPDVSREDWGRNGKLFCDAYEYENDPARSEGGANKAES
jgi:4-oxalocrotonate tautomerase